MRNRVYSGALTAEQFLFYEIRIAVGYYMNGDSLQQAAEQIAEGNLFQYPTLREVKRMTKACYRRLDALEDQELVSELRSAPADIARQINLYAMMRDNLLVWEFMVQLIGEKYRMQDFHLDRKDINGFFSRVSVAPPVPPKSAIVVPPEIVGKQVKHKAYGEGTINGVTDIIIVVSFNSVGEKKLGYEVCIKNKLIEFI